MNPPRLRFTLRAALIVVALLGLGMGLLDLGRLRGVYQARALFHAERERTHRQTIENVLARIERIARDPDQAPAYRVIKSLQTKNPSADYHAAMRDKYQLAARRPWHPVAPDPPEP